MDAEPMSLATRLTFVLNCRRFSPVPIIVIGLWFTLSALDKVVVNLPNTPNGTITDKCGWHKRQILTEIEV